MTRLRAFVENNLYIVAGIALGVAVAQLLGIIYTHLLQLVIYLVEVPLRPLTDTLSLVIFVNIILLHIILVIWLGRKLEGQIEDQKSLWLPHR